MLDSHWNWSLLLGSAFLAGAVNSIAGGGTLLTFPSLLTVLGPVQANATSTLALLPGSMAAGWGYRSEIAASKRRLKLLLPSSFLGGVLGSLLLIRLPERVFEHLVPWLLVTASILMLLQRPLTRWIGAHPHAEPRRSTVAAIIAFQFLVGVYGGYFGAGIGILMLSALAFVGIHDIHEMNGVKTLLGSTINGITAVIFAASGVIVWHYALAMSVAAIAGGYAGARTARRLKGEYVRAIVVAIGFAVAAYSWASQK